MPNDTTLGPAEVRKRDGRTVPFDARKIEAAIGKCLAACGSRADAAEPAAMAERLVAGKYDLPTVEQVQDAVEVVLLSLGMREEARRYMAYRDERARARLVVSPEVRAAFADGEAAMGGDPLRTFQFFDKYSRYRYDFAPPRRETWVECVDRTMGALRQLVVGHCGADRLEAGEWAELRDAVLAQEAMPSMRLLASAGPAFSRDNVEGYNCSYQAITDLPCFRESLLISMAGCGDAYSVEAKFVRQLPLVRHQRGLRPDHLVVPDTAEGWGDALLFGLERWFDGADATFDFSLLRAAGTPLRVKGGRASGPGPLRFILREVRRIVLDRQGSQLRPVDVNDVLCVTGEAGNSGGKRRTAKLSLSDWGDEEMRDAKRGGGWLSTHPWRGNANNSAVWPADLTQLGLLDQMTRMFEGRSGERGIFSRENSLRTMPERRAEYLRASGAADAVGTNPCGEIILQSRSFCNLSQAVARRDDTTATLARKVRVATVLGTIQSLATHFPYLRPEWAQHAREERLLGVDVTGQMDCPILRDPDTAPHVLRTLRGVAREVSATFARRFGIAEPMAITCNKPSGNSSAFLDCAPGINARKMRVGTRNARVSASSAVYRVLRHSGVPMDPENGQDAATATTWVAHFPMRAPDGSPTEAERTAGQQLDHWLVNKLDWAEHNPSVTIAYGPDEMLDVVTWLWEHRGVVGGLSFLPRSISDTVYRQLPYEPGTLAEWEAASAAFPRVDWALIAAYEREDETTSARALACAAGGCEE